MEATMTLKPKVYVGTYGKYNEGSLKGGWLTLTDYKSYDEFVAACRRLHKDEPDAELMIQDCSDMPDGLSCMEWISREEWNDIIEAVAAEAVPEDAPKFQIIDYSEKAIAVIGDTRDIKDKLKELGGRFNPRLSCGAGWIFSKKVQADVEKLLQSGQVEKSEAKPKADDASAKWKKNLEEFAAKQGEWESYYKKHCIGAVKLNDGYYLLDKESIGTKFSFADEGPDYEYYKELCASEEKLRRYFMAENLRNIDHRLNQLQEWQPLIIETCLSNEKTYFSESNCRNEQCGVLMTDEQRKELIAAQQWKRTEFEKRLNTYLKRYGVSKIHMWTYWRDA